MVRVVTACLGALGCAMFIACGGGGTSRPGQPDDPVLGRPGGKESASQPRQVADWTVWHSPAETANFANLQVKITSVKVGRVALRNAVGKLSMSKNQLLAIGVNLYNANATWKVDYQSWGGSRILPNGNFASIADNFGNNYRRIDFGIITWPDGGVRDSAAIYPLKSVADVLVFEAPVDAASSLDLELPGPALGYPGVVRFRIPINQPTTPVPQVAPHPSPAKPEPPAQPAVAEPVQPPPKPPAWDQPTQSPEKAVLNASLMTDKTAIGSGELRDADDPHPLAKRITRKGVFQVWVQLEASGGPVPHRTWADRSGRPSANPAVMADDKGREVKQLVVAGLAPYDALEYHALPWKKAANDPVAHFVLRENDVLFFEVPKPDAAFVDLTLPTSAHGGEGAFRFRIPLGHVGRTD